jgi:hypothetical protein
MTATIKPLAILAVLFSVMQGSALAAEPVAAGSAAIVAGVVSAVDANGKSRLLERGDGVFSGDHIITGSTGYVRIGFADGSAIILRPRTDFYIEQFRYAPVELAPVAASPAATGAPIADLQIASQASGGNQALFRLLRGGLKAISGLVGRVNREEYSLRSPVATIGIRGTEYLAVFCDAACAADPTVATHLPAGESALGGMVTGVDHGAIAVNSVTNEVMAVNAGQYALTTFSGSQIILPSLPAFLASEAWLQAAQTGAVDPSATPATTVAPAATQSTTSLLETSFSTIPTIGGIAAAVAATAAALAFDGNDDAGQSSTATTSTTATSR